MSLHLNVRPKHSFAPTLLLFRRFSSAVLGEFPKPLITLIALKEHDKD